jgi:hypothetical protein
MPAATTPEFKPVRHRPKSYTVFAAAFLAGAAAAVGVNRVLDVHLAQRRPQVECEPIFVALRGLPQGSPVTVWDVALKDWPKAMLPTTALRAGDAFEGYVLRHAVREGQPLLAVQLVRSGSGVDGEGTVEAFVPAVPATTTATSVPNASADLWTPSAVATAEPATTAPAQVAAATPTSVPETPTVATIGPADDGQTAVAEPATTPATEVAASVPTTEEPVAVAVLQPVVPPSETPVAPSPAALPTPTAPALATQPAPAASALEEDDTSEAVVTDVSSIPSVMKQPTEARQSSTGPTSGDAGRFLVVPERIALQADTSFTTPRPQPPGPPTTSQAKPRTSSRPTGQTDTRRGSQPVPQRQTQAAASQPRPTPQGAQRGEPQSATRKSWGGMFPNVAAGIDAIGGQWQRSRSTAGQPRGDQPVSR